MNVSSLLVTIVVVGTLQIYGRRFHRLLVRRFVRVTRRRVLPPNINRLPTRRIGVGFTSIGLPKECDLLVQLFRVSMLISSTISLRRRINVIHIFSLLLRTLMSSRGYIFPNTRNVIRVIAIYMTRRPHRFEHVNLRNFLNFRHLTRHISYVLCGTRLFGILYIRRFLRPRPIFYRGTIHFSSSHTGALSRLHFVRH